MDMRTARLRAMETLRLSRRLPSGEHSGAGPLVRLRVPMRLLGAGVVVALSAMFAITASAGAASAGSAWHFRTEPNLDPPKLDILHSGKIGSGHGLMFLDPLADSNSSHPEVGHAGALIDDLHGNPVWFHPAPGHDVDLDFHEDTVGGKPVLAYWEGQVSTTQAPGEVAGGPLPGSKWVILNQQYHQIATLPGQDGWQPDLHELIGGPGDDVIYTVERARAANLTAFGGPANGEFEDNGVQEVDLATGQVVYTWDMAAHVRLAQSIEPPPPATSTGNVWDPFHLNSIQLQPDGSLLLSARDTWSIYDVNPTAPTGLPNWTLDAKPKATDSTFTFGPGAAFSWQHDARLQSNGQLTMFDDHCCLLGRNAKGVLPTARGLILNLDMTAHTATVAESYSHTPGLVVPTQGSMQILPGNQAFIGWGQQPLISDYSTSGQLLWEASLPTSDSSYRALIQSWTGSPTTKPAIAVHRSGKKANVYVSWNGANQVTRWRLYYGTSKHHLKKLGTVSHHGFETVIHLGHVTTGYVQIRALSSKGHTLGRTSIKHV